MAASPTELPIEQHGVIGDLYTVALVGMDGSIDFLCLPEFDSPSVFAALLDARRGGHFRIAPVLENARSRQLYLPDSNVLLTRFHSAEGVAEIADLMPVEAPGSVAHNLVRRVETVRGEVRFRLECAPRFDHARVRHRTEAPSAHAVRFLPEPHDGSRASVRLVLRGSVPLTVREGDAHAEFTLRAGQRASFSLEWLAGDHDSPCAAPHYVQQAFEDTLAFWRRWTARSTYRGRWREAVNRSALVLKLLCSARHGSLVAAATYGLPEQVGGPRNWDYRYTWIRDASFALYALSRLGHHEEATAFMRWIEARCHELGEGETLQPVYGIDGRREIPEEVLEHLSGYRGSRPVRIGNAARDQLQLDIYGELLDAVYLHDKYARPVSLDLWEALRRQLAWLAERWHQPDEGIWETRGGRQHFLYSRLLCWVAFDRALRLAQKRSLPAPHEHWLSVRDRIREDILDRFWKDDVSAFVQTPEGSVLDASALAMPLMRFLGGSDPRWLSTLAAIERELVEDMMVHRYRTGRGFSDGLDGGEGTFSLCTFWYAECLSRSGQLDRARLAFEKMLGYANHLGLYAEELGPSGEHLGNFPQAFTHMGLISAAYDLDRRLERGARPRSSAPAQ